MSVKVICSFGTLLQLASKMGQARLHGTTEEYEEAKKKHDAYRDTCLISDEVRL